MKKGIFSAKRLCRSGVIAALYVVFTVSFGSLSFFGGMQVRPSEGLCMLPLLYPEAVAALCVGCFLSNLFSPFAIFDITVGVGATLLAALCTYFTGKFVKNKPLKIISGGIFPVLFNAAAVPLIVLLADGGGVSAITLAAYFSIAGEVALSEAIWVYAVGVPLTLFCMRRRDKKTALFE
ncbi:MAG: QueT transporter family protein [Candidatus Borkfalkiaceae bacterium]|nr:QueT transporter family protein [Clostridia bacterium]MDY6223927.1 QueT transporter family protein [Christensenellaceae bacterium]